MALGLFSVAAMPASAHEQSTPSRASSSIELASGDLRAAVAAHRRGADLPGGLTRIGSDSIVVEVLFDRGAGAAALDAIRDSGGRPGITVGGELNQATVPLDGLVALERSSAVVYIRPPLVMNEPVERAATAEPDLFAPGSSPRSGGILGEEVGKTNAAAYHAGGITGAGVKIGIIDEFSVSHYDAAVAAGEIPAVSGTICLSSGVACNIFSGEEHGIGVSEIVTDMAPSAQLYFADVATAADAQAAVNYFASQGVKIINRSQTGRYDGPGNGTGPIASVIDSAVAQGMNWFNAAGNSAGRNGAQSSYWRGGWVDSDRDDYLNFSGTNEYMQWDCAFQNGLRWNDWGADRTDYDLHVYDSPNRNDEIDDSENDQTDGAEPLELATRCGSTGDAAYIRIELVDSGNGTAGDVLEFMHNGTAVQYPSNPGSAGGPMSDSASPGMLSVGAVDPWSGTTIGGYSSEGPTNDGRVKPDLSAPACASSFTYAPGCFSGTSAATPVAAGAAALVLSGGLASNPAEVKGFLLDRAVVERGAAGPDNVYGAGELLLPPPFGSLDRVPPTVKALASKGKPGKRARLRYIASDNSGRSQQTVKVMRRGKTLATLRSQFGESLGGTAVIRWKVPKKKVRRGVSFCVSSADANGNNTSAQSCAKVKIKKKKKPRKRR